MGLFRSFCVFVDTESLNTVYPTTLLTISVSQKRGMVKAESLMISAKKEK